MHQRDSSHLPPGCQVLCFPSEPRLGQAGSPAAPVLPATSILHMLRWPGSPGAPPCCLIFPLSQHPALSRTPSCAIFFGRQDTTSCGCPLTSLAGYSSPPAAQCPQYSEPCHSVLFPSGTSSKLTPPITTHEEDNPSLLLPGPVCRVQTGTSTYSPWHLPALGPKHLKPVSKGDQTSPP